MIYDFSFTSVSNQNPSPNLRTPLGISFSLSDAIVQSGRFTLTGYGPRGSFTGDVGSFGYFDFSGERVTPDGNRIPFGMTANLTFSTTGQIASTEIRYAGDGVDSILTGSGMVATGTIGTDDSRCRSPQSGKGSQCSVAGVFAASAAAVPEPASFALLGIGALALGVVRAGRQLTSGSRDRYRAPARYASATQWRSGQHPRPQ